VRTSCDAADGAYGLRLRWFGSSDASNIEHCRENIVKGLLLLRESYAPSGTAFKNKGGTRQSADASRHTSG